MDYGRDYVELTTSQDMVGGNPNRFKPDDSVATCTTAAHATPPSTKDIDILKETRYFPPFDNLCVDNVHDFPYFESKAGRYVRCYAWCFLGEITWDQPDIGEMIRKGAMVNDRDEKRAISVYFYPESGSFDYNTLKIGHTFCAMFAQQHHFLDRSIGLRIEDLDLVKVIPCSLDNLFAISTRFSKCTDVKCWGCCETPVDELKKCASCGIARYCGKDCQTKDWKAYHKKWCKAMPEFIKLTKIDYQTEPDYYTFVSKSGGRIW